MTQNVKDLVIPMTMVGALLAQSFYLGRASQRLDQAVLNVSKVADANQAEERATLALQGELQGLQRQLADLTIDVRTNHLQWEKDHYQLLARRVVAP